MDSRGDQPDGTAEQPARRTTKVGDAIAAKWTGRRRQAAAVQRGVVLGIAVILVVGCLGGGLLLGRFKRAADISRCRGNLRRLCLGLVSYTADNNGRLPIYGSDAVAALGRYAPSGDYTCGLHRDAASPAYTTAPGLSGLPFARVKGSHSDVPALIETGFRHELHGQPTMAIVYLDGRGGHATPQQLALPPPTGAPVLLPRN